MTSHTLNGDFIPFVDLGDDAFGIEGSHGHYLMVAPALNLVVVHRCADDSGSQDVTQAEFGRLLELHPVDFLRIYRIANYAKESYYYLETLAGNRPLAIRCGLNEVGQIIYLRTIE